MSIEKLKTRITKTSISSIFDYYCLKLVSIKTVPEFYHILSEYTDKKGKKGEIVCIDLTKLLQCIRDECRKGVAVMNAPDVSSAVNIITVTRSPALGVGFVERAIVTQLVPDETAAGRAAYH